MDGVWLFVESGWVTWVSGRRLVAWPARKPVFSAVSPSYSPLIPPSVSMLSSRVLSLRSSRWAGSPSQLLRSVPRSLANWKRCESCPNAIFMALSARMEKFEVFGRKSFSRRGQKEGKRERKREKILRTVRGTRSSGSWWSGWKCWVNGNAPSLLDIDRTSEDAYRVHRVEYTRVW